MKGYKTPLICLAVLCVLTAAPMDCRAEIAGDDAFENLSWEMVYEEPQSGPSGVVQSICATEDYIICIENTSDLSDEGDVVSAYYRNEVDENGNPVERYSLARRNVDTDWEHGNGMAYNPSTGEIYVALYTSKDAENKGCLYVMDPVTLGYKRRIKISDDYNILGIGYRKETDQYVIQTNNEGGYSFKILNSDFQVVEDLGEYADTAEGGNFQDLFVSGDYIINFPLTINMGIGDYIHAYSISKREMVSAAKLDFRFMNVVQDEPEGLCELEPGVYLAVVNVTRGDGTRTFRFYRTEVPYYFKVSVDAENGTVERVSQKVLRGKNLPVLFKPDNGYRLAKMIVDGVEREAGEGQEAFQLENVQENHSIKLIFAKIPLNLRNFLIAAACTAAVGGVIGWYLLLLHVKRERRRKRARARIARQRAAWAGEAGSADVTPDP